MFLDMKLGGKKRYFLFVVRKWANPEVKENWCLSNLDSAQFIFIFGPLRKLKE